MQVFKQPASGTPPTPRSRPRAASTAVATAVATIYCAQEASGAHQEAAQGQEGGPQGREARACEDAPPQHDHCARDDWLHHRCIQRQDLQPGQFCMLLMGLLGVCLARRNAPLPRSVQAPGAWEDALHDVRVQKQVEAWRLLLCAPVCPMLRQCANVEAVFMFKHVTG
eukprot:1147642-Pelagomonas_calceolata.AAC.3